MVKTKLNMGCGHNKVEGYINVDQSPVCHPDIVCNLEELPWPWQDDSIHEVLFSHCLEHLGRETKSFLQIMKELYRVCRDEAIINIIVPHPRHNNFINDPTHVRIITPQVLELFNHELNDEWQRGGYANTPLAHYLGVDFVIKSSITVLEEPYASLYQEGALSDEEIGIALREKNNVASEFRITLITRKIGENRSEKKSGTMQWTTEKIISSSDCLIPDLLNQALQHHKSGQFSEAEAEYLQIIANGGATAEIYKNYGNTLLSLRKNQAAEQAYRKALELNPEYAEAYNNLGNVLRIEGQWNESELAFKEALRLFPDSADIHNNFGTLLVDICETDLAEKAFRQAILLKPDKSMFYLNRGDALRAQGRLGVAIKSYRKASELDPISLDANIKVANTLLHLGEIDEAEKSIMNALELHPDNERPYSTLGSIYAAKGLFVDAEAAYLRAIAIKPDNPAANYCRSLLKLLQGYMQEGFRLYENRFMGGSIDSFRRIKDMFKYLQNHKRWSGESVNDKTLLVITEQGAGDVLMMMRYLCLLKTKGFCRIVVYCDKKMVRLLKTLPEVDEVFSKDEPLMLTGFDYYCPMMSFPYLFQTGLDSIPDTVPYLIVSDAEREKWLRLLDGVSGLKVGLVWAGSSINLIDKQRSIPISEFRPLAVIDGIHLISLQKVEQCGQSAELGSDCIDYMDMCHDYLDTAALIMELDLVISVDTSVAHLAGALGKPVWLLNRFGSEWRWMLDREDSPWYPTMRIFNQKEAGNWAPVIDAVVVELKSLIAKKNNI